MSVKPTLPERSVYTVSHARRARIFPNVATTSASEPV
jgi:hypothetical protein